MASVNVSLDSQEGMRFLHVVESHRLDELSPFHDFRTKPQKSKEFMDTKFIKTVRDQGGMLALISSKRILAMLNCVVTTCMVSLDKNRPPDDNFSDRFLDTFNPFGTFKIKSAHPNSKAKDVLVQKLAEKDVFNAEALKVLMRNTQGATALLCPLITKVIKFVSLMCFVASINSILLFYYSISFYKSITILLYYYYYTI
jgi:hypothetical protein